jgi:hypothetical protein
MLILYISAVLAVKSKQSISSTNGTANNSNDKLTAKVENVINGPDRCALIQNHWSSHFNLQIIHPVSHHSNIPVCSLAKTLLSLLAEFKQFDDDSIMCYGRGCLSCADL